MHGSTGLRAEYDGKFALVIHRWLFGWQDDGRTARGQSVWGLSENNGLFRDRLVQFFCMGNIVQADGKDHWRRDFSPGAINIERHSPDLTILNCFQV